MLAKIDTLVTPDTLLRWYRRLVAAKYDGSAKRGRSQQRRTTDIVQLVLRMANDNPTWGYTRIRGALYNLGHDIGRNTIKRILQDAGITPAPERSKRMFVERFSSCSLGRHRSHGLLHRRSAEVLTWTGLVRYHVLFVIDIATRRVEIAGIVHQPHEAWMKQVARNLTDAVAGFLLRHRYIILDRDPLYTPRFRRMLGACGVRRVRLPPRSPNLNAYAERFIGSVRRECLDRVVPVGEQHLRHILREYVDHYHTERNHQALDNKLIVAPNRVAAVSGKVLRRKRLGGVLNFYHREAA